MKTNKFNTKLFNKYILFIVLILNVLIYVGCGQKKDINANSSKRIVVVNTNCYHGYDIEESIEGISAAGAKYIELTATEGWTEHVFRTQSFSKLLDVRDLLKDKGLIPIALSGHTNIMDENRIPDFIDNIRLANFFGCRYIVTSIGEAHMEDKALATETEVAEHIKTFIPYLDEYDLILVLELHGDHNSGKILNNICKLVNSDRVKINYDTGNAIYWGGMTIDEMLVDFENCINSIGYMHIKDKIGKGKTWNFPAVSKGEIPFEKLFEIMKKHNKCFPLSIEIEFTEDGTKNIQEVNDAVKISLDYLNKVYVHR